MIRISHQVVCLVLFVAVALCFAVHLNSAHAAEVVFKRHQLDSEFRSEGVAVGDFNRDGKMDIAANNLWYEAPDWKMHVMHGEAVAHQPKGYSPSFATFADDLNGDGWTDVLVVSWPGKETICYENPQGKDGEWTKRVCTPVTSNESPQYLDVDGDGRRDILAPVAPDPSQCDGPERCMAYASRPDDASQRWKIHVISEKAAPGTRRYSHGLGLGDVNGDGRADVVVTEGWWEAPLDAAAPQWKFHAAGLGQAAADMVVYDFDGDGDNDVLSSSAHMYGIWWHEQLPGGKWQTHEIDKRYSQTHALELVDINGDGLMDFVTGKRWWAHGGKDPGADGPAVMYWYELTRKNGRPVWIPHKFDDDSGVGTQFEVADVNGDGLPDVVTANKKGVYYFEQTH